MTEELRTKDQLTETLSLPGALLVADSTVYDPGDMHKIALKVLAHEFRVMRADRDRLQNILDTLELGS